MTAPELRARREAIVREHMESENILDFDTTIGTFAHPRYELVATGDVYDGEEAVSCGSGTPGRWAGARAAARGAVRLSAK